MSYKIDEIEGIGPTFREKLTAHGIETTDDLLKLCAAPKGRKELAAKSGLGEAKILDWTNMADLMRVSGVGRQFAELLKAAGVDTIKEFRTRNPENLATKIKEVNEEKKLAKAVPTTDQINQWIEQAKKTDPLITY